MAVDYSKLLGDEASYLLEHKCSTIAAEHLYLPGPDFAERVVAQSDRPIPVMRTYKPCGIRVDLLVVVTFRFYQSIKGSSILGASFAPNPIYFDPAKIVELAIESGCSGVASTLGVLASTARKYAHRIPYIVKLNHNELMTYPQTYEQISFGSVQQAFDMGAIGVGATVYFGSEDSNRQLIEIAEAFEEANSLGLFTILWCYTRNSGFKHDGTDYHTAADLTSQANHLGVTIKADIIKQKMPTSNGGFREIGFGKTHPAMYDSLCTDHPIDLCRYQVAHCYMGRNGLINSGGASGDNDLNDAIKTAIINKRAGGMGLILGRKAFQRPVKEGVELLNAVQDVYLDSSVSIA